MRETWYVLEDGSVVDPSECSADEKGLNLTHKSGVAVAMKGEVPHSRGVDLDPDGKPAGKDAPREPKVEPKQVKSPHDREMKAAKPKKYETR